jgi:hypothetical protein
MILHENELNHEKPDRRASSPKKKTQALCLAFKFTD